MRLPSSSALLIALGIFLLLSSLTFSGEHRSVVLAECLVASLWILLALRSPLSLSRRISVAGLAVLLQFVPLVFWAKQPAHYLNDTVCGTLGLILAFQTSTPAVVAKVMRPKGWSFNPSALHHRWVVAVLALVCSAMARYLAVVQLGYETYVWDPFFGNGSMQVISSALSHRFPVSDAALGSLCYLLEFVLAWQGGESRWKTRPWLVCAFGFLILPVGGISVALILAQPLIVGAWCSWCLMTALLMLVMIVLSAPELIATVQFLFENRSDGSWRHLFFQGDPFGSSVSSQKKPKVRYSSWNIPRAAWLPILLGIGVCIAYSASSFRVGFVFRIGLCLGPLIIAIGVLSCSEVLRAVRYVQWVMVAALMAFAALLFDRQFGFEGALYVLIAAVLGWSVLSRGMISNRYGKWDRFII